MFPCLQEKTPAVNDRRPHAMQKLLVIDDEEAMRRLLRLNLSDTYEVIDTGDPEQGLALAMQNKPSAILLDLRMPRFSVFELCRTPTTWIDCRSLPAHRSRTIGWHGSRSTLRSHRDAVSALCISVCREDGRMGSPIVLSPHSFAA